MEAITGPTIIENAMDSISKNGTPTYIKLMSLLFAFYLSINIIMITISPSEDGVINSGGLLGLSYSLSALILFMIPTLLGHISLRNISFYSLLLVIILIVFYQHTETHIGSPRTPFLHFFVFTIISFLLPVFIKVDARLFLKAIMVLSLPALFKINQIFIPNNSTTESLSMGYSYSFLMPIVASFVYYYYYFQEEGRLEKIITLICVVANLLYCFFIIAYGSRGPIVAIILLLAVMYIFKRAPKNNNEVNIAKGRFIMVIIALFSIIILLIPILTSIQLFLDGFDIHLNFIDKILNRNNAGDVTSGRTEIWAITISSFLQSPLLGYGIDQFENNTSIVYPHNFILQLLYDGGLFLTTLVIIPMLRSIVNILRTGSSDRIIVTIALFFGSIPGALLSADLWTIVTLWVFFGSVLSKKFVYEHQT